MNVQTQKCGAYDGRPITIHVRTTLERQWHTSCHIINMNNNVNDITRSSEADKIKKYTSVTTN